MTVGLCSLVVHFRSPDRMNCNGYCIFTNDFQWMITALNARFASLPLFHEPLCHVLSLSGSKSKSGALKYNTLEVKMSQDPD